MTKIYAMNLAWNCLIGAKSSFDGKDINSQVKLFDKTLINVFVNFIINDIKTFAVCNPPWMTDDIKNKLTLAVNIRATCAISKPKRKIKKNCTPKHILYFAKKIIPLKISYILEESPAWPATQTLPAT